MTVKRKELTVAFSSKIEPLGFDRFKTCELMAELLHCSNMGLLNERGSEALVRQRDEERDRLKAEGSLTASRHVRCHRLFRGQHRIREWRLSSWSRARISR